MSKKTVLITGCSDGRIGSELALVFQKRGFHVFATARDPSKMNCLSGLSDVTLLTLDVVKPDDITAATEAVSAKTSGGLDCLISNAGRNHFMPILDENLDVAEGVAAYITSISGYLNVPYMAAKRSLEIVAETLRLELAPFGVGVLEVVTGAVKSQGQTYFNDLKLPSGSLYASIEDTIMSTTATEVPQSAMDAWAVMGTGLDELSK